jgi:hypothetical protein
LGKTVLWVFLGLAAWLALSLVASPLIGAFVADRAQDAPDPVGIEPASSVAARSAAQQHTAAPERRRASIRVVSDTKPLGANMRSRL